ncbi:deoxyribose-phosphate aldolase [bacterium]|nr:deoxyribose-phosphate aldolase [bacterium]
MANGAQLAGLVDHAFLKVGAGSTVDALRQAAEDTLRYGFRSLCLPPVLAGTVKKHFPAVRVSVVVAYPLGLDTLSVKLNCVQEMIELGVEEVDIVYDLFALCNSNWAKLSEEARRLGKLTSDANIFQKAIIETPILTDEQIRTVAELLLDSPVDCVKTSTGYHREPTSLDHVRLLRKVVGTRKQVKAAGGIKNFYHLRSMLDAGADIIGTSSSVAIIEEADTVNA